MKIIPPTSLTDEQLADFKRIYTERYAEDLTDEEATEKALHLLRFLAALLEYVSGTPAPKTDKVE